MTNHNKFYVYSKNGCLFCERLVEFMDSHGISYEKFTLGTDFDSSQFIERFGTGKTFPQVSHNYSQIGGMRDTVKYLVENKLV